jgi:hypothetical protein
MCRLERRLSHWPFGVWNKRKCDFSGETIITTYPENCRFPVYKREHWFTDKWTPPEQEVDFSRSFFDQLYELQCKTPHFHQLGKNNENCDYADDAWDCKSAYLSRSMGECEDVLYVYRVLGSKDCADSTYCYGMVESYECTYCFDCFNLKFSLNSRNCSDSSFLYDCRNCTNCFMCWNLRNKEFYIENKHYSKEEYFAKLKEFKLNSRMCIANWNQKFDEMIAKNAVHKADFNVNNQNCDGNYITNCKNCHSSYFMENCEDCSYSMRSPKGKSSFDMCGLYRSELCYEVCQSTDLNNVKFAYYCIDCRDGEYIDQCFHCNDLFGCVGLHRKQYCILNKQYSKEEYLALKQKIIDLMKLHNEYGEFFPYKFAYNGFNLSLGAFYFKEDENSVKEKGGFWEQMQPGSSGGINANELPDTSDGITNDFVGKPVSCAATDHSFSFIQQELDFYKKHKLPLPIYFPEERNLRRFAKLVPLNPRQAECFNCGTTITTYYPESWGYSKIACEKCYLEAVY